MRSLGIAAILVLLVSSQVLCRPQNKDIAADDYVDDQQDQFENDDPSDNIDDAEEEGKSGVPPEIKTKPQHLYAKPGENVRLPCDVINEDGYVLQWQKGTQPIFFGGGIMVDRLDKYELANDSLIIKNVEESDASDEWTCTLLVDPTPLEIKHTLIVQQSPPPQLNDNRSSLTVVPKNKISVNEGESIRFGCETAAFPKPEIKWYFKGKMIEEVPNVRKEGNYLFIDKATRHHVGAYQCLAEDRSSNPQQESVEVMVNYAPVIEVTHKVFHTGIGRTSVISCLVDAHPHAHVKWHKNSIDGPVHKGEKSRKVEQDNKVLHSLTIQHTTENDLGTYVCHAVNNMSAVNMDVILTGVPAKPVLNYGEDKDNSLIVRWRVESFSPIEEAKLEYRAKTDDKWTVMKPQINNAEGNQVYIEHHFPNLMPGVYEVKLMAKNVFGWSVVSAVHEFRKELVADEPQKVKGHSSTIQPQAALTALLLLVVSSRVFTCL